MWKKTENDDILVHSISTTQLMNATDSAKSEHAGYSFTATARLNSQNINRCKTLDTSIAYKDKYSIFAAAAVDVSDYKFLCCQDFRSLQYIYC